MGRPEKFGRFSYTIACLWGILRQIMQRIPAGKWLIRRSGDFWSDRLFFNYKLYHFSILSFSQAFYFTALSVGKVFNGHLNYLSYITDCLKLTKFCRVMMEEGLRCRLF